MTFYGALVSLSDICQHWLRYQDCQDHELTAGDAYHGDVIKWKHFPRYWPFVRGIHRSPVNSPHKGQWHGALTFFFICAWINDWVNNREAGDLRGHRVHYDITAMYVSDLGRHWMACQLFGTKPITDPTMTLSTETLRPNFSIIWKVVSMNPGIKKMSLKMLWAKYQHLCVNK